MESNDLFKRLIVYLFMVGEVVLGIYLAPAIRRNHEILVQGILGILVIYMLYRFYLFPNRVRTHPLTDLFTFPRNIRYFGFGFFWTVVVYWAVWQFIDAVTYMLGNGI